MLLWRKDHNIWFLYHCLSMIYSAVSVMKVSDRLNPFPGWVSQSVSNDGSILILDWISEKNARCALSFVGYQFTLLFFYLVCPGAETLQEILIDFCSDWAAWAAQNLMPSFSITVIWLAIGWIPVQDQTWQMHKHNICLSHCLSSNVQLLKSLALRSLPVWAWRWTQSQSLQSWCTEYGSYCSRVKTRSFKSWSVDSVPRLLLLLLLPKFFGALHCRVLPSRPDDGLNPSPSLLVVIQVMRFKMSSLASIYKTQDLDWSDNLCGASTGPNSESKRLRFNPAHSALQLTHFRLISRFQSLGCGELTSNVSASPLTFSFRTRTKIFQQHWL